MSRGPASTTEAPSKTARRRARALVNKADELLAGILEPTSWQPDSRRRAAFINSEDFDRILGLYIRAMDLDALEPAYPWNLGSALNRLGRPDLALAFIGRAVKTAEKVGDDDWADADGYLLWAETAINAGQDEIAFVVIMKAVEQAPEDEETHEAAVRLLKALADVRNKRRRSRRGADVPVWVPVLPGSTPRSAGADAPHSKGTEELMADLLERAFPTATPGRKRTKRTPEPA